MPQSSAKGTGDLNIASFFMLKLLPPKNGTPAIEKKKDKKGRLYLTLHVRDCAGGGTYICNVFNNTGLADKVLSLNDGKGLSENEMFIASGSFSSYGQPGAVKKALRVTSLVSYGDIQIPQSSIAGDGNDVTYSNMKVVAINPAGEAIYRFTTKQKNQGVKFCLQEVSGTSAGVTFSCIAFGHLAEKIIGQRLVAGDSVSVRGSLHRLPSDGRELYKMSELPKILSRAITPEKKDKEKAESEKQTSTSDAVILTTPVSASPLGGRSFG